MKKQLKSIVCALTMVVAIISFSVPVMAAEDNADISKIKGIEQANVITENLELSADEVLKATTALVGEFHYTGRLTKGKQLGTVDIGTSCRTVKWTVGRTGSSEIVILKITNQSSGESRTFTTYANNYLGSLTWVSNLPAGLWDVSVYDTTSNWVYDVDLYFYN